MLPAWEVHRKTWGFIEGPGPASGADRHEEVTVEYTEEENRQQEGHGVWGDDGWREAFSDGPWGVGSLGVSRGPESFLGVHWGQELLSQGSGLEAPLSGCTGDHGSEVADWSPEQSRGLGNGRDTRNEECKAPRGPSARNGDSAPEQRQARTGGSRGPRSADGFGSERPARTAQFGCFTVSVKPHPCFASGPGVGNSIFSLGSHHTSFMTDS